LAEINQLVNKKDKNLDEQIDKEIIKVKNLFRKNNFDEGFAEISKIVS